MLFSNRSRQQEQQQRSNRKSNIQQGLLAFFVLGLGILICLVNVLYLLHVVDVAPTTDARQPQEPPLTTASAHGATTTTSRDTITRSNTEGKEPLLEMLEKAGIHNISQKDIEKLPTWSQVVQLYGDEPKIVGLDTCPDFISSVPASQALVAPAGPFNSGTNLLAELLLANCILPERKRKTGGSGVRWQVNWGKHQPPRVRLQNYVDRDVNNNSVILPVVAVRDPYSWLQSMCRRRYAAHWFHYAPGHCPNLIPNKVDWEFLKKAPRYKSMVEYHQNDPWLVDNVKNTANFTFESKTVPVYVKYKLLTTNHESLAHMWNDWYTEYLQAEYPRVFVRMEDLVFYPRQVTERVCHCAGGTLKGNDFIYVTESAKKGGENIHGSDDEKTSLLSAMIRYGSLENLNKTRGMTHEDVAYARKGLLTRINGPVWVQPSAAIAKSMTHKLMRIIVVDNNTPQELGSSALCSLLPTCARHCRR